MGTGGHGVGFGPPLAKEGAEKFGFRVGQRVRVKKGPFCSWEGIVINFDNSEVAVDLCFPPEGKKQNGQWFFSGDLIIVGEK